MSMDSSTSSSELAFRSVASFDCVTVQFVGQIGSGQEGESRTRLPSGHAHQAIHRRDRVEVPSEFGVFGHLVLVEHDGAACRVIESERDQDCKHVSTLLSQLCRNLQGHGSGF